MKKSILANTIVLMYVLSLAFFFSPLYSFSDESQSSESTEDPIGFIAGTKPALVGGGMIEKDGSLWKGHKVKSSTWTGTHYEIAFRGAAKKFIIWDFMVLVTPLNSDEPIIATVSSVSDKLLVYLWDVLGNNRQERFYFQIYKFK